MKLGAGVIRVSGATIFRGPGGTVKGLAWVAHAEDVGKGAIVTLEQIIKLHHFHCIFEHFVSDFTQYFAISLFMLQGISGGAFRFGIYDFSEKSHKNCLLLSLGPENDS